MTPLATDWDQYYDRPAPTAHLTRRYTARWLQTMMRRYTAGKSQLSVIEFGGGNSCFFKGLTAALPIISYEIVDLNAKSLALFEQQGREVLSVTTAAHRADLLKEVPILEPADSAQRQRVSLLPIISHCCAVSHRRRGASPIKCHRISSILALST